MKKIMILLLMCTSMSYSMHQRMLSVTKGLRITGEFKKGDSRPDIHRVAQLSRLFNQLKIKNSEKTTTPEYPKLQIKPCPIYKIKKFQPATSLSLTSLGLVTIAATSFIAYLFSGSEEEEECWDEIVPEDQWRNKTESLLNQINACLNKKQLESLDETKLLSLIKAELMFVKITNDSQKKQLQQLFVLMRSKYKQEVITQAEMCEVYKQILDRLYWNYRCSSCPEAFEVVHASIMSVLKVYHTDHSHDCAIVSARITQEIIEYSGINAHSVELLLSLFKYNNQEAKKISNTLLRSESQLLSFADIVVKEKKMQLLAQETPCSLNWLVATMVERIKERPFESLAIVEWFANHQSIHHDYQEPINKIISSIGDQFRCMTDPESCSKHSACLKELAQSPSETIKRTACKKMVQHVKCSTLTPELRLRYLDLLYECDYQEFKNLNQATLMAIFRRASHDEIRLEVLNRLFKTHTLFSHNRMPFYLLAEYLKVPRECVDQFMDQKRQTFLFFEPNMLFEFAPPWNELMEYILFHPHAPDSQQYQLIQCDFMNKFLSGGMQEKIYRSIYKNQAYGLDFRTMVFIGYFNFLKGDSSKIQLDEFPTIDPIKPYVSALKTIFDPKADFIKRLNSLEVIAKAGIGWNAMLNYFAHVQKKTNNISEDDLLIDAALGFFNVKDHSTVNQTSHWLYDKKQRDRLESLKSLHHYPQWLNFIKTHEDSMQQKLIMSLL